MTHGPGVARPAPAGQGGSSAIEFAIVVPVLLALGLGVFQWALVFHARQALEHAAIQAARAASVGNALPGAVAEGLARGLLPYWSTVPEIRAAGADRAGAVHAARLRVQHAQSAGWIVFRQISPTDDSFSDWAEPSLDAWGRPQPGNLEIPNDNLMYAELRAPRGGAARLHLGLPVGRSSGQTLLDANVFKIEIVYGVPMTVPLVGRIAAAVGRAAGACLPANRGGCAIHEAPDAAGRPVPRWPIAAVASVRMQSPARQTAAAPSLPSLPRASTPAAARGAPSAGSFVSTDRFGSLSGTTIAGYGGVDASRDGALARAETGWLLPGGDRLFAVPGACTGQ